MVRRCGMAKGVSAGENKVSLWARAGVNMLKKLVYEMPETGEKFVERRASDRDQVVGDAAVTQLDATGKAGPETRAFVRDASENGCGLWSRVAIPVGATVMVAVTTPGQPTRQRVGRVRHCRGQEGTGFAVGVEFNAKVKGAKAG